MKANAYVIVGMILVVVVVLGVMGMQTIKSLASNPLGNTPAQVSATGNFQLSVMPDTAFVRIKVETEARTAEAAQNKNSEIMTKVQSALKRAGVDSSDIESDQYNLYPWQEWDSITQKSVDKGFRLYHTIKVTTDDFEKVGELITVAVEAGANGIENIQFDLSDSRKTEVKKEALQQASKNAKDKALAIADGLGVRLGELLSIQESDFNYGPIYRAMAVAESDMGGKISLPAPVQPEQLDIQATVSVSYRIA